jgi:prephenate dehydratase/chorismate mutase
MSDAPRDTEELRLQRAQLDRDILALLLRRARLSRDAAKAGGAAKLPSTERDTLDALVSAAGDELPGEAVRSIFREIHAACRALEAPVRVVHAGEGGEGGEAAARRSFGSLAQVSRADSAAAALEAVTRQTADFAVLPYESTTEGMVASTLQALRQSEARIVALVDAEPGATLRHAVAALRPASRTGRDVTALLFTASDEPGALFETLKHFAERGVNLRKIQSRPAEGEGYLFFVEMSGHITDRALVSAIEGVKKQTRTLKILGSFPA